MGLAPRVAAEVYETLSKLRERGLAILLVEQSAPLAFRLAQRGCVLQHGRIVVEGPTSRLSRMDLVQEIYLGRDDRVPVH
jgi:branched-chain amino acid transport system ATP-binding protein